MTLKSTAAVLSLLALAVSLFPAPAASLVQRTVLVEETGWAS
jgi:hypothetical protein